MFASKPQAGLAGEEETHPVWQVRGSGPCQDLGICKRGCGCQSTASCVCFHQWSSILTSWRGERVLGWLCLHFVCPVSVPWGCSSRQCLPHGSLCNCPCQHPLCVLCVCVCVSLSHAFSLATGWTCKGGSSSRVHWPGTETPRSPGAPSWAPAATQGESPQALELPETTTTCNTPQYGGSRYSMIKSFYQSAWKKKSTLKKRYVRKISESILKTYHAVSEDNSSPSVKWNCNPS